MKINWKLLAVVAFFGAFLSIVAELFQSIIAISNNATVSIIIFICVILLAVISVIFGLEKLYKIRPKWLTLAPEGYQFNTWFFIFFIAFIQVYNFWLFDILKKKINNPKLSNTDLCCVICNTNRIHQPLSRICAKIYLCKNF